MLVLNRRIGESVTMGGDVTFMVLGIKGNQARVRISAPKDVAVRREEIYQRIRAEKLAGAVQTRIGNFSSAKVHPR